MFTKKKIIFDTYLGEDADSFLNPPLPSKKVIPEWYKKIETLHNRDASQPSVKKCMPFLDALSMGYTISTGWDIHIKKYQKEGVWNLEVSYAPQVNEILTIKGLAIDSHSPNQFSEDGYNSDEIHVALKIISPWLITTPPGYSCIFLNPLNHTLPHFRIFSGVVDTDIYPHIAINFPCATKKFEGTTKTNPAGTPLAMVIPFKRDDWQIEVNYKKKKEEEVFAHTPRLILFKNMLDNYKNKIWNKKNFD